MKFRDLLIGAVVLAVMGGAAYLWLSDSGLSNAPDTSLTLVDGKNLSLDNLQGKTVVVNFWATTCIGCRREIPHLVDLKKKFGSRGLEVVGVAMSYDPADQVAEFARRFAIEYPIGIDTGDTVADAFGGVRLVPTTFIISPEGRIVFQKLGEFQPSEIDPVLEQHLKPAS